MMAEQNYPDEIRELEAEFALLLSEEQTQGGLADLQELESLFGGLEESLDALAGEPPDAFDRDKAARELVRVLEEAKELVAQLAAAASADDGGDNQGMPAALVQLEETVASFGQQLRDIEHQLAQLRAQLN
jgi:chromosome segregation ATPase